jgi:hypothetical protein
MLKPKLLFFWVSATVTLVALAPFVFALVQSIITIDGFHEGEI